MTYLSARGRASICGPVQQGQRVKVMVLGINDSLFIAVCIGVVI